MPSTPNLSILRERARCLRTLRAVLDGFGYLEVQVPLLSRGTTPDRHLQSFDLAEGYLLTSTEYPLKRLYAAGIPAAYTLGPNFRRNERGALHNPEFTMLEWGRVGATLTDIEAEAEALFRALGVPTPFARTTVSEALHAQFGTDSFTKIPGPLRGDDHRSWAIAQALSGLDPAVPTWVCDWPQGMTCTSTQARSELMWCGLELADGFPFETTAQRPRSEAENSVRAALGLPTITQDEAFLDLVLPPGAGMALGVDRLCMALVGCDHIDQVLTFAWEHR